MKFENAILNIKQLEANKGQLEGLPANPRSIKGPRFDALYKSISDNPEMLNLRELLVVENPNDEGKYVVIGGNMRLKAMRSLSIKEAPVKIIKEYTIDQLKAYTIKDNNGFGEWSIDMFKSDWNYEELLDWGIDVPDWREIEELENEEPDKSSDKEHIEENDDDETLDEKEKLVNELYADLYNNDIYKIGNDGYIIPMTDEAYKYIESWEQLNDSKAIKISLK